MNSLFDQSFFRNNRRNIKQKLGDDTPIIITANGILQRSNDTTFPFHQHPDFWYLTGIEEPDVTLCMLPNETFLMVPQRSAVRAFFDGEIDAVQMSERSGIREVLDEPAGWQRIRSALAKSKQVYTHTPKHSFDTGHGMYLNPAQQRLATKLKRTTKCKTLDIQPGMAELRLIKQPPEIQALEAAVNITCQTIDSLRESTHLSRYAAEYELEAAITAGFRHGGATGHGYSPIVAGGKRATTLHYVSNMAPLSDDEFIVVDVGAEVEHYSADITRTLIASPPSARQQAIFDQVLRVRQYALDMLKPGIQFRDYERAVHQEMGTSLHKLGLITDATDSRQIWQYYPHATSHFLGLDVHDVGDYNQQFTPGMVLTCEPGIYVPEEGIGIRLEDDILITEHGHRILGKGCSLDAYTV